MTERLYYADSYLASFKAEITDQIIGDDSHALILDRTAFYPEGGGQPSDYGYINGVEVMRVEVRQSDHAILHIMAGEVQGDEADCQIDWSRRFDLMQHHTGQHILTHAFEKIGDAQTIAFHLGEEMVTIDLNRKVLDESILNEVERFANEIITENRPVNVRFVDPDDDSFRMRKAPDYMSTEKVRVIEIPDADITACGGTHVKMTGEIGLIKIIRVSSYKSGTRVEFLCGGRALRDYQEKNSIVLSAAHSLSVGHNGLEDAIGRLNQQIKESHSQLKKIRNELLEYQAEDLLNNAVYCGRFRLIQIVLNDVDSKSARWLASELVSHENMIVCIGLTGDKAGLLMARSDGLELNANDLMTVARGSIPELRGGGPPDFVQAGGFRAGAEDFESAFVHIRESLGGL